VVDLLNLRAVSSVFRPSQKLRRGEERRVHIHMGQIQEEGLILVLLNKLNGFLGIAGGQSRLIRVFFEDLVVSHQRERVKSVFEPFREVLLIVALCLKNFRESDLIGVQPHGILRHQNNEFGSGFEADAFGIAPRHQRCARWRTDRRSDIEIGKAHPLFGHLVEVRRAVFG